MSDENPTVNPPSRLHMGAAYYPEHWPEDRWHEDIYLMKEAGLSVVRMGEFAWSTFEPAAGEFHFEWMERAIKLLGWQEIKTVMGTPTAAPPAWLVQQYPDMLAVDEDGRRVQFGNRCHYCVNSPDFHEATRRIVTAMGEFFGPNPNIIGWQLDNEYGRVCYCERCQKLFQEFLAERYETLENLNQRWSTAYWSQTYSAWDQIPIPIGPHNPGLMLEWKRFITESYRKFQKLQIDALRPYLQPAVWITHNFMGWFDGYDHYTLNQDLDMATWDWYIGTGHNGYQNTSAIHDLTRGFKRQNFWVMETQPGSVNWSPINNMLNKGEGRTMAWQAIGHGADAILYWQWRSALGGQEQYHGTLVDQSGQPRPFYAEVKQTAKEIEKVSSYLAGTKVSARTAILYDYESRWSIQWQPHHKDFDYVNYLTHYYRPLAAANVPVDILSADSVLTGYRMVVAPALLMFDEERVAKLKDFVRLGGYLVLTVRCGMKDRYNALLPSRQPGPLAELGGVQVNEYYALNVPAPIKGNWFEGRVQKWGETLNILDTKNAMVVARYGAFNGWMDGQVAITVCGRGTGMVYYVGAYLDDVTQVTFFNHLIQTSGTRGVFATPNGVEATRRTAANGDEFVILINHESTEKSIALPWPARELLNDRVVENEMKLEALGVAVLTKLNRS
jgi:beta-galactosidase